MTNLAVYIHWPFCKAKCPYCDFNSHVRASIEQERWRQALLSELAYMQEKAPDRVVTSIFFGGGTPSLMPPETAQALIERVHALWPVTKNLEITLEANPTSVEAGTFPAFAQAGINRVSLGVQALQPEALAFLGRGHSVGEALTAIERAQAEFERVSFDLIYARPQQTLAEWDAELDKALALGCRHLSLYQLTIEENTAFHHSYAKGGFTLPDEEMAEALYRLTEEKTAAAGLYAYEVSNYAIPGQESRHNLSYWQGDDYIGIGPGAHGRLRVNGQRYATQTLKSPERWLESVEKHGHGVEVWQAVEPQQEVDERVMMGLRLREGIGYRAFQERTGIDLHGFVNPAKKTFYMAQGLLVDSEQRLQPTLKGRLVLNTLTAELLSH